MIPQFFLTAAFVIAADQCVKYYIKTRMTLYSTLAVIPDVLNITHIENFGIAFGLTGQDDIRIKRWLLCAVIFAAIVLIVMYWAKNTRKSFLFNFSLGLIAGGAAGNLIDRVLKGSVTDFIDLGYKAVSLPVFNIADAAVSAGVVLYIIYLMTAGNNNQGGKNASDTV